MHQSTPDTVPKAIALSKSGVPKEVGAATLASEECTVLALAYSDVAPLPPELIESPTNRWFAPERTAGKSNPKGGGERTPSLEATYFKYGGDLSRRRQSGLRPRAAHRRCQHKPPGGYLRRPAAEQEGSPLSATGKRVLSLAQAASSIRGVISPGVSTGDLVGTSLPSAQVDGGRWHRTLKDLGLKMVSLGLFGRCR